MNSKALRRLAADHGSLHSEPLPVNYLFLPTAGHTDDLTQLDILIAGPTHTPFEAGVWKLHLTIPPTYPQQPPIANFRTPIFHPNVDPDTGGVCVETLKRDWDSKFTLRDVLITISCLLIQPNPDSALNSDAGALIQENYESFARRAELMTRIHARIGASLTTAVKDAQNRGQESSPESEEDEQVEDSMVRTEAPARRRRTIAKVRGMRRPDRSPSDKTTQEPARRRQQPPTVARAAQQPDQPFVVHGGNDDVFGAATPASSRPLTLLAQNIDEEDSEMLEANQENDSSNSPVKVPTPARTPRRPRGTTVPLGELIMPEQDDIDSSDESENTDLEQEYPPSPRKSPLKSAAKPARSLQTFNVPESSSTAAPREARNITPMNFTYRPLAADSPFGLPSLSPKRARKGKGMFELPKLTPQQPDSSFLDTSFLEHSFAVPPAVLGRKTSKGGIARPKCPSSAEHRHQATLRRVEMDEKLWELCGGDIRKWNRGDFEGDIFKKKASRW